MEKSKPVQLLRTLTKKEIVELESFLRSPYHNKDEEVIELFLRLKRSYPDFTSLKVKRDWLVKDMYGDNSAKSESKFKYPVSGLIRCIEDFLLIKALEKEKRYNELLRLRSFMERGLDKFFFKRVSDIEKKIKKAPIIDADHYLFKHMLYSMVYEYPNIEYMLKDSKNILEKREDNLDLYYYSSKLYQHLININQNRVFQLESEVSKIDEIIKDIKTNDLHDKEILFSILLFFIEYLPDKKEFNAEEFNKIKDTLFKNYTSFGEKLRKSLTILLFNYTSDQYSSGNIELIKDNYEIIKLGIEHKILIDPNGSISPFIFYAAIVSGGELNDFKWVDQLIKKESKKLPSEHKYVLLNISTAFIEICKGNFGHSLQLLNTMQYAKYSYFYDVVVKCLTVRCYYEMDESIVLEDYINTFSAFLRRHKQMPEIEKKRFIKYVQYVNLLSNYPYKGNSKEDIKNKLSQEQSKIYARYWLNQKVEQL